MGCGQFWRREALEAVIAQGDEPEPAYLELQLPSVAHHLGFRLRGLGEQDRFISNHVIPGGEPELMRDIGAWVMHPVKNLRSSQAVQLPPPISHRAIAHPVVPAPCPPPSPGPGDESHHSWMGDLSGLLERIACVATGRRPMRIMRGGRRLAIGLPANRRAARVVLDLYHPHRFKGRLFRVLVRALLRLGVYHSILRPQAGCEVEPEVSWLRGAAESGLVGFVGGNPAHGPRCLLGGFDRIDNPVPFVGKLGFDDSRAAIVREAAVLERLAGRFPGVLRPLAFDSGPDWALLRLPYLGFRAPVDMAVPEVIDLLVDWLGTDHRPLGETESAGNAHRACAECRCGCRLVRPDAGPGRAHGTGAW